jgi:hypothetical protein
MSPNAKKLLHALRPKKLLKPLLHPHDDASTDADPPSEDDSALPSPAVSDRVSVATTDDLAIRTASMRSEISQGGASSLEDMSGLFEDGLEVDGGGAPNAEALAPLSGGVLVDELYGVTAKELNRIIYAPGKYG